MTFLLFFLLDQFSLTLSCLQHLAQSAKQTPTPTPTYREREREMTPQMEQMGRVSECLQCRSDPPITSRENYEAVTSMLTSVTCS